MFASAPLRMRMTVATATGCCVEAAHANADRSSSVSSSIGMMRLPASATRTGSQHALGPAHADGAVHASAHVHVGHLDGVVPVAEPVPGGDLRLHVARCIGRSRTERVPADV